MVFSEVVEEYMQQDNVQRWQANTAIANMSAINYWLKHIGDMLVAQVTADVITEHRDSVDGSPSTLNRYVGVLSGVMTYAVKVGYVHFNPCAHVKTLHVEPATRYELSDDEESKLLKYLWINDRPLYEILTFSLWTGAEKSEILPLTWQDFDMVHKLCTFSKSDRTIPINEKILDLLTAISNRKEPNDKRPECKVFTNFTRYQWNRAIDRSLLPDINFRDLRHTFIMRRVRAGHSMPVIARYVGRKGLQYDSRYASLTTEDVRALAE